MSLSKNIDLPETILFIGAGFSRSAGGLTTFDLSKKIKGYLDGEEDFLAIDKAVYDNKIGKMLEIESLKKISEIIRGNDNYFLPNLFTLLDYNLEKKKGLKIKNEYFDVDKLYRIKKTVEYMVQKAQYEGFKNKINEFNHYREFCECLQEFMIEEHYEKITKYKPYEPEYYISSFGVITPNWDGIIFYELMKLNNKFNHISNDVGLYLDFGELLIKKENKFIYSMDEGSIQRNNKRNEKPYRIMKYIALHGMFGTRVCPHCNTYFGNFGDFKDEHYEMLNKDYLKCPNCGTETRIVDSPLYYQSYVERNFVYLIEKWEEETINYLRKAKRYVFIGYSFPEDDLQIRRIFFNVFSDGRKREAYVIDYSQNNKSNRWYDAKDAREKFKDKTNLIEKYEGIFGEENVKFNFSGGMEAFLAGNSISCDMVNEVLKGDME